MGILIGLLTFNGQIKVMENTIPVVPLGNGIWLQLAMNLVPFLGVLFYDWSVFALIYSFWLETLGMSFFSAIKVLSARGEGDGKLHLGKAFRFMVIRTGILLFYLLFIVVFIGLVVSGKQETDPFVTYLLLLQPSFRWMIIGFFVIKFLELIFRYFMRGEYLNARVSDHNGVFDSRIIIIHVVIVLGVFAHQYFSESMGDHMGVVAFAGVFVVVKSIAELVSFWLKNNSIVNK